jgi:hypothetical protein
VGKIRLDRYYFLIDVVDSDVVWPFGHRGFPNSYMLKLAIIYFLLEIAPHIMTMALTRIANLDRLHFLHSNAYVSVCELCDDLIVMNLCLKRL